MNQTITQLSSVVVAIISGIISMLFVFYLSRKVLKSDPETSRCKQLPL